MKKIIKKLVEENNELLDVTDRNGKTSLYEAVAQEHIKIAQLLLELFQKHRSKEDLENFLNIMNSQKTSRRQNGNSIRGSFGYKNGKH